ncbi:MAG: hypothetical protein WAZ77_00685 [Candidatus Nitrosopolaris sp.]
MNLELHPLPDEDVTAIDELPVYSINKPKPESLVVLKILDNMGRRGNTKNNEERQIDRGVRGGWYN